MANISIRKLDEQVYKQLRKRAAAHHVSMEEEARQIISLAVSSPERMSNVFRKYFGPTNGIDIELSTQRQKPHDPWMFSHDSFGYQHYF